MAAITVTQVTKVTPEILQATSRLMNELAYTSRAEDTLARLQRIVDCNSEVWFIARTSDGQIVGTVLLITFEALTSIRSLIECLAVDPNYRGQGVASQLMGAVLTECTKRGVKHPRTITENQGATVGLMEKFNFHALDWMRVYIVGTPAQNHKSG